MNDTKGGGNKHVTPVKSLWALTHPGPSLVTALAYAIFALLAAHGRPDPIRLLVTVVGMIGMQFAISTLNDYCDRKADVLSHKVKPVAQGLLEPWVALLMTAIFTAVMLVCYAPYGLTPLFTASAFLLLGFAYDLGLKSTPLGAVLMGLAFPLLPLLAWELFATVKPALYWTFAIGLALGISIHLADALPDTVADAAAGASGLTQTLGHHALGVCWLLLAGANLLVIVLGTIGVTPVRPAALFVAEPAAFILLITAVMISTQHERSERQRLRVNFVATVLIALVTAVGWVISAIL